MRLEGELKDLRTRLQSLELTHARALKQLEESVASEVHRTFSLQIAQLDTGLGTGAEGSG